MYAGCHMKTPELRRINRHGSVLLGSTSISGATAVCWGDSTFASIPDFSGETLDCPLPSQLDMPWPRCGLWQVGKPLTSISRSL